MAYESVKNQIDAYIKANGVNLITGPVLNAVLTTMLDELGEGYAFQGALNTTDTPSPAADIPQAWLASAGTYLGGSITVDEGELALIIHTVDGWSKETVYRGVQLSHDAIVDALGYAPADEEDLAEKQDTIADLSTIRSGAALGETSVQPVDIENMVEAEPIGSIIPPVNPSEFATKEEVSQLGQEVTDLIDVTALCGRKIGPHYFSATGMFTYGVGTASQAVKSANATYDSVLLYVPAGVVDITLANTSGILWGVAYSMRPSIGDTGGTEMTKTSLADKTILSVSSNTSGLYVLITLLLSQVSAENIIIYGGISKELDTLTENNLLGYTGNPVGGFSYCGMWGGSTTVKSANASYNGVIVKVPAGISQVRCQSNNNVILYGYVFDSFPVIGMTGGEYAVRNLGVVGTFIFSPKNTERYILFTLNLSRGSINDFYVYPFPTPQIGDLSSLKNLYRKIDQNSADITTMTGTGYIQEDGTIAANAQWKNGYIPLNGIKVIIVNHIAVSFEYTSTYFYFCDSSKNGIVGYQLALGQKKVLVPENAAYLFLAVQFVNNANNGFYCEFYDHDIETELQAQISRNTEDIALIQTEIGTNPVIVIPADLYAVQGRQFSIYYDSIIKDFDRGVDSPADYYVDIESPTLHAISPYVGVRRDRMWQLYARTTGRNAYSVTGEHTLHIKVYDKNGAVKASTTSTLHIIYNTGLSSAKNILCVGDSLTNNGPVVKTMADDFIAAGGTTPNFIGTRTTDGYHHEGWPGYTFQRFVSNPGFKLYVFQVPLTANMSVGDQYYIGSTRYIVADIRQENHDSLSVRCDGSGTPTAPGTLTLGRGAETSDATVNYSSVDIQGATPFWNDDTNEVDITNYRSEMGMGNEKFDLVVIMLGTNDCLYSIKDMSSSVTAAKTLIDAFLEDAGAYPTKIILQLTPADANTISSWQVYADQNTISQKVAYWINLWSLRQLLVEEFTKSEYSGKVFIGQAPLGLDRYYGYPYETFQSEDRINIEEIYHTNSVHPNTEGYQQLGDGYFLQGLYLLKQ